MVPKCGKVKVHHWAHPQSYHCDPWKESETGRLVADVRNQGERNLLVSPFLYACELEVDGQWYRRPPDTLELRQRPKPFSTGQQYDNIAIKMDRWWELKSPQNAGRPGEPDL